MKNYIIITFILGFSSFYSNAQLSIELIGNLGINKSIISIDQEEGTVFQSVEIPKSHFGISAGGGVGARLHLFERKWSVGMGVNYLYKYHESNFEYSTDPNTIWHDYFIAMPIDLNYNFKNNIGLHFGVELSWCLNYIPPNPYVKIKQDVITSPLVGVSYTYKRFRFELLYKHSIQPYTWTIYAYRKAGTNNWGEDRVLTRYQDLELRVVFRLHEFKEIKL